jgi:alpha-glucoside transport system permease protein
VTDRTRGRLAEPHLIDDVGPPRRGRGRLLSTRASLWLAPGVLLLAVVVAWPVLRTAWASLAGDPGQNYLRAVQDPDARSAIVRTLSWAIVVPLTVTVLGYLLALASRRGRTGNLMGVLFLAPTALPLVVVGVSFRLLYDPVPDRGTATPLLHAAARLVGVDPSGVPALLGPALITPALMSAFVWAWVGLAILVFRAALDQIPAGLEDAVRSDGGGHWRVVRDVHLPLLRGVAVVLIALVAVASARSFDLILMMAPGSVRDESETLAVYIWQATTVGVPGPTAALSVIWIGVVGLGAIIAAGSALLIARSGGRRDRTRARVDPAWPRRRPARTGLLGWRPPARAWRAGRRLVPVLVLLFWAVPIVLLLVTSFHRPTTTAVTRWAAPFSVDSYRELADSPLPAAFTRTLVLAVVATFVVVAIAVPAAYVLAWYRPPGFRLAGGALLAAAVMPVQVLGGPLHEALLWLGLSGTAGPLLLVHIGLGIPVATLVLRNAFAAVPADRVHGIRLQSASEFQAVWRIVRTSLRAPLIAIVALQFVQVWNDLVVGLLFSGPELAPLGMELLGEARQFDTNAGVLAAGAVVMSVVPVVVVMTNHRRIIAGLVAGVPRR